MPSERTRTLGRRCQPPIASRLGLDASRSGLLRNFEAKGEERARLGGPPRGGSQRSAPAGARILARASQADSAASATSRV